MTNINCSCQCIHQKDGKCNFESVKSAPVSKNSDCAYFTPRLKEK